MANLLVDERDVKFVHLVLARVGGDPPESKGISIFTVPKNRLENGSLVDNDLSPAAVEKKLGLHGSPTGALNVQTLCRLPRERIGQSPLGEVKSLSLPRPLRTTKV